MTRAALKLFSSEEDALEFLEDYGLDEARIKLLEKLRRIPEAAEIHVKNGDVLKAVEILTTPAARNVDHVQLATKFILAGLWQDLTIGALPTPNPIVSKLLGFANRLDKSVMTKKEVGEVSSSHLFNLRVLHPITFSLQCSEQFNVLTIQVSARLPRLSLGSRTTLLLCCAWTTSSHPL